MVQSGTGPSILELHPRPPTPPRKADNSDGDPDSRPSIIARILSMEFGGRTPPNQSPDSSAESSNRTSEKSQKRVEWSTWTEYKDPPNLSNKPFTPTHEIPRPLPPSGELKPTKSILKPYNGVIAVNRNSGNDKLAAPHTFPNFAAMLESIVRQLAGEDRSSRIDAYMTLSNVLKAADNVPDVKALKDKMSLLTQFIRRDMTSKTASGTLDTTVVNNALTLLSIFLYKQSIADIMSIEFCSYVVDHSINAFEDTTVPKEVVKHLLFTMGTQRFSAKVMNLERVGRLIRSLSKIEEHVKGRSIILGRMTIYRRLLEQAKMPMLQNISWLENLVTEMFSSLSDVRRPAIAFGFEAALQLGHEKQASRAVMALFDMEYGEQIKYGTYLATKLTAMVHNKQDKQESPASSVPQIWSVIVLFLRHKPHQLEHWEFMNPLIRVLQECFNKGDYEVKAQANFAWNRLVFALRLDENTAANMIKMLGQALSLQLKRKLVGRHAKEIRQVTVGSVCNLLYYALRPNSASVQLDLYWDEYVIQLIGKTLVEREQELGTEQEDLSQACAMMGALFDNAPKPWVNNRANEPGVVEAQELPGIDPKWIRKNSQRVFLVLGPLVEKCFWDLTNEGSPISTVWKKFVACVASAGMKEVKVSNDTMTSVAFIFNLLFKIWQQGPKSLPAAAGDADSFEANIAFLMTTAIGSLGVLPFTEKLLSIGPQETFAIVATPSHHPLKPRTEVMPPLHHLLGLLAQPPGDLRADNNYSKMIVTIIRPFFDARTSQRSRIDLLKDLSQLVPTQSVDSSASIALWRALATCGAVSLDRNDEASSSGSSGHDQPLGVEYRQVLRFLDLGISLYPKALLSEWKALFVSIASRITLEAGDSGRAIALIEPLARTLSTSPVAVDQRSSLEYFPIVVSTAIYPVEKQALDAARRRIWGTANANSKLTSFEPFFHLYIYARQCLADSYTTLQNDQSEEHVDILTSVTDLIRRCPVVHTANLLLNVQEGIGMWIRDEELKFRGRSSSKIAASVAALWEAVCSAITRMEKTDSDLLQSLEPLLCAGLESKHQSQVSDTITLWNSTFGCELHLEYPSKVKESLLRLRSIADIQLPSFPEDLDDELMSDAPIFLDSQEDSLPYLTSKIDTSSFAKPKEQSLRLGPSLPNGLRRSHLQLEVPASESLSRSLQGTPERTIRKGVTKDLTPKLRHDDSQIQFAAIDSSPLDGVAFDSQLLTDRQREVKERQAEEAAMFPDLRSSPRMKQKSGLSKLASSSAPLDPEPSSAIQPTTPTFAGPDKDPFDDYVTSSPTPRRGHVVYTIDSDAIDPPSSPPEQPVREDVEIPKLSFVSSQMGENEMDSNMWDVTSFPSAIILEPETTSTDLGPSAQIDPTTVIDTPVQLTPLETLTGHINEPEPLAATVDEISTSALCRSISSPGRSDFVDAFSSPMPASDEEFVDAAASLGGPPPLNHDVRMVLKSGIDLTRDHEMVQQDFPTSPVPEPQSPPSSPMSDMDDDSMLRLITKFDNAPRSHHDDFAVVVEGPMEPVQSTDNSIDHNSPNAGQHNDTAADESDCIIVEMKDVPADYMADFDPEPKPQEFLRRTRTSPWNLKNGLRSTVPETPASRVSEPLKNADRVSSEQVAAKSPIDLSMESKTAKAAPPATTESSRVKKRRSIKGKEIDTPEPNKRRRTDGEEMTPMSDGQGKVITNISPRAKKTTADRTNGRTTGTRSSPRVTSRTHHVVEIKHPSPSIDLDAPIQDSDADSEAIASQLLSSIADAALSTPQMPIMEHDNIPKMDEIGIEGTDLQELDMKMHETAIVVPTPQMVQARHVLEASVSSPQDAAELPTELESEGSDLQSREEKKTASSMMSRFASFIEAMRSVALTREEAKKMEDMDWDFKAELIAAEKRGRQRTEGG